MGTSQINSQMHTLKGMMLDLPRCGEYAQIQGHSLSTLTITRGSNTTSHYVHCVQGHVHKVSTETVRR